MIPPTGGSRGDEPIGSGAGNNFVSPHFHDGGEFEGAGNRTSLTPGGGRLPTSPLSSPLLQPFGRSPAASSPLAQSRGGSRGTARKNGGLKPPTMRWDLDCPRMAMHDLHAHASRLLPNGTNSPGAPWQIPLNSSRASSSHRNAC